MTDPPFEIGLRLSVNVSRGETVAADALGVDSWRQTLLLVTQREVGSRTLPPNIVPDKAAANRVLGQTFANHPMVNVSGRPVRGRFERSAMKGAQAFVIAEVVLLPELAPIPRGGKVPRCYG